MRNVMMILVAITLTFAATMIFVIVKFGGFNITNHTDHYITTCNGEVVNEYDNIVTDRVDYTISVNEGFNLFKR